VVGAIIPSSEALHPTFLPKQFLCVRLKITRDAEGSTPSRDHIINKKNMSRTATPLIITTPKERRLQIEKWEDRDYSWSQHSSFLWNKQQWFSKYIKDIKDDQTKAMIFGNVVGDTLGTPTSMVPSLAFHKKAIKEYKLNPKLGTLKLLGYCDFYTPAILHLDENKTSANPTKWNKMSVQKHDQLTMYALMLMLQDKVQPENLTMKLHYIPVEEHPITEDLFLPNPEVFFSFPASRTLQQVLAFGNEIKLVRKAMKKYATQAPL